MNRHALLKWVPGIFVLLWATGFIGAKYGLPYAEPFTLLSIRMWITLVLFLALTVLYRAHWPDRRGIFHSLVVGTLIHAAYLGGVFSAIEAGMSAGLVSLLVGLQPILTTLLAWGWLRQRVRPLQTFGLLLGLAGVAMVLLPESPGPGTMVDDITALYPALIALAGISIGTLYQKHFCAGIPLLTGTFYQYMAATMLLTAMAFAFETRQIDWQPTLVLAIFWLVFGLSLTAILLLMMMIREGETAKVASYFYLTPPVTAIMAWLLFGEMLAPRAVTGILVTAMGVYLVVRRQTAVSLHPEK
jgi:drug/metabolite transporter (DMT)-like permease